MLTAKPSLFALLGAAALLLAPRSGSGNSVPYAESFEAFTNGHPIGQVTGWTAGTNVLVSTNAAAVGALTNSSLFPLGGPHAKVLEVAGPATNALTSSTGGVAVLDFLVMPTRRRWQPNDDAMQLAVYASTNGLLTIWHRNATNAPVNEWRELTNSPVLATDQWARVSVRLDQSHAMFQVSANGAAPLVDEAGWTSNNGARPGSWFYMVQTNRAMADVTFNGDIVSYFDDLVVANRGLTLSTNGFAEAAANDGSIDNSSPMTIGLAWDTFAATNNENLVSDPNKLWVTNMPQGLAVSALVTAPTQLTVTVTGQVGAHEATNSVSNLTFIFGNAAFSSGRSWDVAGASTTNLAIRFQSSTTAAVSYAGSTFAEAAANDGRVTNTLSVSLTGDTFNNAAFAQGTHFSATNVPAGLTLAVAYVDTAHVSVSLTGAASPHNSGANRTIAFSFLNAAFQTVAASNVVGSTNAFGVTFLDPPVVSAAPGGFTEAAANNGTIGNTVSLSLSGTAYDAGPFSEGLHYTVAGVPAGLGFVLDRSSDTQLVASLTSVATPHAAASSTSLVVTLHTAAFQTVAASNITGSVQTLGVTFLDPPQLDWSGVAFTEAAANNGAIGNMLTLTLAGASFTNGAFAAGTHFTATGVPPGLTLAVSPGNATQAVVQLTGQASPHTSAANTNIALAFTDAAFLTVAAANIGGSSNTLSVTFLDPSALSYAPLTFMERGDDFGAMGNTVAVSLSNASFAAGALLENVAYTVAGVPPGLSFALARNSDTSVTVSLGGQATSHANANDAVIGLTFRDAAFQVVGASNILGSVTNLAVDFIDLPPANAVPFADGFEAYPNGFWVVGTNGWNDALADAGIVTNAPERVAEELAFGQGYPLSTTHAQILQVNTAIVNRTRSVAGRTVCLDWMAYVQGRSEAPAIAADDQVGLYVDPNQQVTVWHRDTAAGTNLWTTLTGSSVATGAWHRVTLYLDYGHALFKVKVDSQTLSDAAGWSGPGGTHPGPWFNMGQQNGYLSWVAFGGGKADWPVYVDDISIGYDDPLPAGTIFKFR